MSDPTPKSFRGTSRAAVGVLAIGLGGCAERELIASPDRSLSAGAWTAVWVAGAAAALLLGALLTLPAWRARSGARLAVAVLAVQTGAVAVIGTVLTATAARSWQLVDQPADSELAITLLRLSRVDGDASFLLRLTFLLGALTLLATVLSAACARLAAADDWPARSVASGLLTLELGIAVYLAVLLLLGERGLPFLGGLLAVPVLLAALMTCLPRRAPTG